MSKRWSKDDVSAARERLHTLAGGRRGLRFHATVVKVSRSGLQRKIRFYIVRDGEVVHASHTIAVLSGTRYDADTNAVVVSGCGMDMGFHVLNYVASAQVDQLGINPQPVYI